MHAYLLVIDAFSFLSTTMNVYHFICINTYDLYLNGLGKMIFGPVICHPLVRVSELGGHPQLAPLLVRNRLSE